MFHPHGSLKNKDTWKRKFKNVLKNQPFEVGFFLGFFRLKPLKVI